MDKGSRIILPNGDPSGEKNSNAKMKNISFKFQGNTFILELVDAHSYNESSAETRTVVLPKETRSMQNLTNLLLLSLAKDLKASGADLKNFTELCKMLSLSLVTSDLKQITLAEELEKS